MSDVDQQINVSTTDSDLPFQLYMAMRRYCKVQERIRTKVGKSIGLTEAQYYLVRALALSSSRLSYTQLAKRTSLSHNSVSTLVKGLVKSGVIQKHPYPDDGRITELSLSSQGEAMVQNVFKFSKSQQNVLQKVIRMIEEDDLLRKLGELEKLALEFFDDTNM
ncbi:MarR family winged helix-turn-helix transcriptional regulator [Alicyclobacillus sp. SO9]|uniref:MarR family winged helix-turn-helix transcriptional regulator n=1 Tax=Alicyclobacillus sp. SO9 TaxID=2665646 RepID=UPI0018E814E3|nr:MarR family transcriptional regulator [Alicyclobacillus sp. SO9]QQE79988.1 MarR family transcriptional regulator [Alicyclobacillus sp. SO9]